MAAINTRVDGMPALTLDQEMGDPDQEEAYSVTVVYEGPTCWSPHRLSDAIGPAAVFTYRFD
ncbi:MAG: hypothetical protein ABEK12_00375, partial [Candidatus Nanohaloarchaea archaeon]